MRLAVPALVLTSCGAPVVADGSRCVQADLRLRCTHQVAALEAGDRVRDVLWQVPVGTPPAEGWPAVVVFHGAIAPPSHNWHGGLDAVVPAWTMWPYHDGLEAQGTPVSAVVDGWTGHAWFDDAPELVLGRVDRW